MAKAKIVRDTEGLFYGIRYKCPCDACGGAVILPVAWLPQGETRESPHNANKPHWSFNGDFDAPVFGPSVLTKWGNRVCHSFVGCNGAVPGQIVFLSDCTHSLANQTVDLQEVEA